MVTDESRAAVGGDPAEGVQPVVLDGAVADRHFVRGAHDRQRGQEAGVGGDVAGETQRSGDAGALARSRTMKPSGVLAGNSLAVCVDTSVVDPSGSVNFTAIPRTPGALSGCVGLPEPLENRISAGTAEPLRCAARESWAASAVAVNVPR